MGAAERPLLSGRRAVGGNGGEQTARRMVGRPQVTKTLVANAVLPDDDAINGRRDTGEEHVDARRGVEHGRDRARGHFRVPGVVVMTIGVRIMMMMRHPVLMGERVEGLKQRRPRTEAHRDGEKNASHTTGV